MGIRPVGMTGTICGQGSRPGTFARYHRMSKTRFALRPPPRSMMPSNRSMPARPCEPYERRHLGFVHRVSPSTLGGSGSGIQCVGMYSSSQPSPKRGVHSPAKYMTAQEPRSSSSPGSRSRCTTHQSTSVPSLGALWIGRQRSVSVICLLLRCLLL
jgi:hypothetical protein